MEDRVVGTPRRPARLGRGSLPLALALLAGCGGATDSRTLPVDGVYVLLSVDGRNLPTIVASGLSGSETLLSARLEIAGASARDIKERRQSYTGSPVAIVVDTVQLSLARKDDHTLLMTPTDFPTLQPDTASFSDGVVANGALSVRTRSAPTNFSSLRQTLLYSRQQ